MTNPGIGGASSQLTDMVHNNGFAHLLCIDVRLYLLCRTSFATTEDKPNIGTSTIPGHMVYLYLYIYIYLHIFIIFFDLIQPILSWCFRLLAYHSQESFMKRRGFSLKKMPRNRKQKTHPTQRREQTIG